MKVLSPRHSDFDRALVVLAEGAVELGDDVGRAAADLGQLRGEVRDVELPGNARRAG